MTMTSSAQQIHALLPQIRGRREEIERARELPRDLVQELQATGIFRLGVPRALGGDEGEPLDAMRAIETVATADGSTGWCIMLGIGSGVVAGYMPDAGAREIFADPCVPHALVAEPAGAAVPVDGGFRVSGRWKFASGITYATWVVAGCVVIEDGQPRMTPTGMPEVVHVVLPVSEVQIHDTWYVSGLCGTGSNDLSCADVFVPERRTFSLFDSSGYRPEPQYQMPVLTLVAPAIASVSLGIARAALDELCELAVSKVPTMSMSRLAEKPVTQVEIARAEGALGAARSYLYDTLDGIWETVVAGGQPTMRQRSLCRIASIQAVETASRVAHTASTLAGGTSVYNMSSLQRHARDADVITHHITQSRQVWEDTGRVLLGFDPLFPLF
ncbi:MAG: acyl-CoA dehydrogenase family protein [Dehalococcoidia bacterium]